jgi:hypothetical protein
MYRVSSLTYYPRQLLLASLLSFIGLYLLICTTFLI